jgi:hypothetical protein
LRDPSYLKLGRLPNPSSLSLVCLPDSFYLVKIFIKKINRIF